MSMVDHALTLASRGFSVFPCIPNGKLPVIQDFPNRATRDPKQIAKWWKNDPERNIGISTSCFGEDQALVVVDVDVKGGKRGDQTLLGLELDGCDFPGTFEQATPTGGRHLVYVTDQPCKQGVDVLGSGLDVRARGGYILGPGSQIDGKFYSQINGHGTLVPCPAWLVDRLGVDRRDRTAARPALDGIDPVRARARALAWIETAAPAIQGEGGDVTTFKVAARLKDFGCDQDMTLGLMAFWNERCSPPWTVEELQDKVAHAFKYGQAPQGAAAPEASFVRFAEPQPEAEEDEPKAKHPFAAINDEYAYVKMGAFVLHETTDCKGAFTTQHLNLAEFHSWHANVPWATGNQKPRPISMAWMEWSSRRQYEGVVFQPQKDAGPRWYNLWRGFRVQPSATAIHPSVAAFMEHALENVCNGDQELFHWLLGYFAHLIQRPWEKPLVALVFKGKKGTGKNALVERVGHLLGSHFLVADDDRYLLGNFNSHLEANLFFVLDEAAWAGDKKAEGRLKGLITGAQHNIERKGKEPYAIDNLTRVAIIGNEDWLVPASQDERRFAVFNLGEGRMQDRKFFIDMREGMEQGGYACLLRCLLDFDLSTVDVNDAPKTQALTEQKLASMTPIQEWWYDCLRSGQIAGGDFGGQWPDSIPTNRMREAYRSWSKGRNIHGRLETEDKFGGVLAKMAPHITKKKRAKKAGEPPGDTSYAYLTPGIERLRSDWEHFIGGTIEWPE